MEPRIAVIGAGWAGVSAAHRLDAAGIATEVFEKTDGVGGHSRSELMDGVVYEPNGAHIFHSSDEEVASFVQHFGLTRPYAHTVSTEVFLSDSDDESTLMSWPPQIDELKKLPIWGQIANELDQLASEPVGDDFETYVISMMGPTLYDLFIREYTIKQWGVQPSELSSSLAPKRVELRSDGYRRLFRDRWEFFAAEGINDVVARALGSVPVAFETEMSVTNLEHLAGSFEAVIVTAPLDVFLGRPNELAWRGVTLQSHLIHVDGPSDTMTRGYVINHPSQRVPYTRTIETKHATGQQIEATVVSEEYPGSPGRHYPIPTPERRHERTNEKLKQEVQANSPIPVYFCGRLANYQYINQDQAIRQGFDTADRVLAEVTR